MIRQDAGERVGPCGYLRIHSFLSQIKASKTLTPQQKRTLWGQAVHGDLDGALRGYENLVSVKRSDLKSRR